MTPVKLEKEQFERISQLVYHLAGIHLHAGKQELVNARLTKRLRALGLKNFDAYMEYLESGSHQGELVAMIEAMTTNKTSFFRESQHFDYLRERILPELKARRIRIWSAGCSSGEEPYSIAIVLNEAIQNISLWDISILATDLSTRMLARARKGVYEINQLREVPAVLVSKYFTCVETNPVRRYQVNESIRRHVHFARLNLMEAWPMRGPFDLIFCRNVMIYFDKPTQGRLVNRFWKLLKPGGYLFVGHSESLTGSPHKFRYVQPAIYMK
ncbi:MAG: protein-glutamate O-methyltransferase [Syntrophaceae bacterium]|nr:protein-glutamate O-methyltransferase [Syntrophaceae bacterium]